jgi:ATP-dependent DNA helicase RecG
LTFFTTEANTDATADVKRLLAIIHGEMTRDQMKELLGLQHNEYFRKAYIVPALDQGFIEMTIPDKPKSPSQKYKLTKKGLLIQKQIHASNLPT